MHFLLVEIYKIVGHFFMKDQKKNFRRNFEALKTWCSGTKIKFIVHICAGYMGGCIAL